MQLLPPKQNSWLLLQLHSQAACCMRNQPAAYHNLLGQQLFFSSIF
jgi:hypothetical protein